MTNRVNHQDVVKRLLDAKAVDFAAIGKVVTDMGPSLALADEPWEGVCGTMRYFIHIYRLPPGLGSSGSPVELPNVSTSPAART